MMRSQTISYPHTPRIRAAAGLAGRLESEGPIGACFDEIFPDDLLGCDTWEKAESEMLTRAIDRCLEKAGVTRSAIGCVFSGDLENQLGASAFAARGLKTPFFGLYGACSTVIEGLILGSALVDGGYLRHCICSASSHFCTAERAFRAPLELGGQRPPSAQRTATASGALCVDADTGDVRVTHGTIGRIVDFAVTDTNHMGAAMAPAVCDTLCAHLNDLHRKPSDYDLIVTGDLGIYGRELLLHLLSERGVRLDQRCLLDCGALIFAKDQDAHAGGSGCGCIASVLAAHFVPMLVDGRVKRLLALGSGAMHSPTSAQQGESVPGISYAVALEGVSQ